MLQFVFQVMPPVRKVFQISNVRVSHSRVLGFIDFASFVFDRGEHGEHIINNMNYFCESFISNEISKWYDEVSISKLGMTLVEWENFIPT